MEPLETNRLIAYNLRRARVLRGFTQQAVAEMLEPYTGKRVGKATISASEKSVTAPAHRVRKFTVNDLVAYCRVFDLPVQWFFIPPPDGQVDPILDQLGLVEGAAAIAMRLGELAAAVPGLQEAHVKRRHHMDTYFRRVMGEDLQWPPEPLPIEDAQR